MIILGIETSCDETSASLIDFTEKKRLILSNIVSSQIDIHKEYGGVVPEIAAREHVKNINVVLSACLEEAKIKPEKIDLIAVTSGPGLITSLIIGVETAKALSLAWKKPLLAVNHMYAHLAANFLNPKITFPAIALIVSGGHTELILLKNHSSMKKIGQTVDDAAGEAFDKVAKLLGLGYPGGPIVSKEALNFDSSNPQSITLPRPMIDSHNFNFSFSGLKTAVLYKVNKMKSEEIKKKTSEICFEFQEAAVEVLTHKTIKAAKQFQAKTVLLAGGVAANRRLRSELENKAKENGLNFLVPEFQYCTDNAAMIAIAGYYLSKNKKVKLDNWKKFKADPGWELE